MTSELDHETKFKEFILLFDKAKPENAQLDDAKQQMTTNYFHFFKTNTSYAIVLITPTKAMLVSNYRRFLLDELMTHIEYVNMPRIVKL